MKILVVICTILGVSQALSFSELVRQEWNTYKLEHGKRYSNPREEQLRMEIFMENKMKIAKHNEKFEKGEVSYKMGLNQYGDMTHKEFVSMMTSPDRRLFKDELKEQRLRAEKFISRGDVSLPAAIDWREKGAVSRVKNQGSCGGCWAFGATGAIESQYLINGKNVSLSEQNLIDCADDFGNLGCSGGFRNYAFDYIISNGGVDTEESYPYEAKDGRCRFNAKTIGATISSVVVLPEEDQQALKEALATVGPVGVAMDAGTESFQFYTSGVFYDSSCHNDYYGLNHEVLAVGYGTENGDDYWIIKNSWGKSWGDAGYFKISTRNNNCGIATDTSYPVI
ncbi:cathepsin L [Anabrus simplex]|uniref:cathepsin L n=1 Tax=Anabrus simplex TaxID=316456 RepID=UPI0035A3D088